MADVSKNSGNVSKTVFVSVIVVLIVVSIAIGFVGYQLKSTPNDSQLQTEYQNLQSSYNQLQSSYQNLTSEYNKLNSQYLQLLPTPSPTPSSSPAATLTLTPQEQVAVQGVSGTIGDTGATVYAQYIAGGNAVIINGAIFYDSNGGTETGTIVGGTVTLPTSGALTTVVITGALIPVHTYTVTLTSSKGYSFVSPSFVAP